MTGKSNSCECKSFIVEKNDCPKAQKSIFIRGVCHACVSLLPSLRNKENYVLFSKEQIFYCFFFCPAITVMTHEQRKQFFYYFKLCLGAKF